MKILNDEEYRCLVELEVEAWMSDVVYCAKFTTHRLGDQIVAIGEGPGGHYLLVVRGCILARKFMEVMPGFKPANYIQSVYIDKEMAQVILTAILGKVGPLGALASVEDID